MIYHVLNRANARMTIFGKDEDYAAFERVLEEAVERTNTRLLAYCVMPNHRWHQGTRQEKSLLASWPMPRRPHWLEHVNAPQTEAELKALRRCVNRGCPFGETIWSETMVQQLGLETPGELPNHVERLVDLSQQQAPGIGRDHPSVKLSDHVPPSMPLEMQRRFVTLCHDKTAPSVRRKWLVYTPLATKRAVLLFFLVRFAG